MIDYNKAIAETADLSKISGGALFSSLGTFWTQIFKERGTLRGLTLGQAQEAIQQYISLVEAVAAFSVEDCPVFSLEKWLPLVITKSKYNKVPFIFEPNGAVFGVQTDRFYEGQVFQFGYPKTPRPNIYAFNPDIKFGDLGVMANRIISPSVALSPGVEFLYAKETLYFNFDIFNDTRFPKTTLVGDNGTPVTFIDSSGVEQVDEFTVVWVYCAEVDKNILFDTYGRVFNLERVTSEEYKVILEKLLFMHTDGPTIENITSIVVAMCGQIPVQEQEEIVEDFFSDGTYNIVVTDLNVYKIPSHVDFRSDMKIGLRLKAGDAVSNSVEYYDNVVAPQWWKTQIKPNIGVGENVLLGNYQSQVYFSNSAELLTVDWNGKVHFPVTGSEQDVATFNAGLDQEAIKETYNLSNGQVYVLNPLEFLFENFLKNNTCFLRLRINIDDVDTSIFTLYSYLRPYLPPHVWFLFSFEARMTNEFYNRFQNTLRVEFDSGPQILNADASNSSGEIESLEPYGYTDVVNRLFAIGHGGPEGLNCESVSVNQPSADATTVLDGRPTIDYGSGYSTKEIRSIQLMTFPMEQGGYVLLNGYNGFLELEEGGYLLLEDES